MTDEKDLHLLTTAPRSKRRSAQRRERVLRVVVSPDPTAKEVLLPLSGASYLIGRRAEGPGRIADLTASREHARIVPLGDGALLEDLGGSNGTFHNGVALAGTVALEPNDVIAIGETLLVVDEDPPADLLPTAHDAPGDAVPELIGISFFAERARRSIATVAVTPGSVLILGATGTGKEIVARATHRLSQRSGVFVAVNAAAIPAELAESELFGHAAGAFTGATGNRVGLFERASGGTLFLDELGDLPLSLQAKLLRVVEDRAVTPVGGSPRSVDLRLVAATQVDIENTDFRSDLRARLADWTLRLLPLSERRADIVTLVEHGLGPDAPQLSAEAAEALLLYDWPANVRELLKMTMRVRTLARDSSLILLEHLPEQVQAPVLAREATSAPSDAQSGGAPDLEELTAKLRQAGGNLSRLSAQTGWHRTQIYRWVKKHALDIDDFR